QGRLRGDLRHLRGRRLPDAALEAGGPAARGGLLPLARTRCRPRRARAARARARRPRAAEARRGVRGRAGALPARLRRLPARGPARRHRRRRREADELPVRADAVEPRQSRLTAAAAACFSTSSGAVTKVATSSSVKPRCHTFRYFVPPCESV